MRALLSSICVVFLTAACVAADRTPAPLSPEQAVKNMIVPEGFKVSLVASEPDIVQPVSFCFDDRGRIIALEVFNYGEWQPTGKDRVVILEDKDGDGRHETRTVFFEGLNYATGIEYGFGGYWVMSVPNLYFIPDRNGDDKPDGPPEVLFDGFGYKESRHNLANGFTWGPDGWLYFGHGRTSPSDVGRPGTPGEKRTHSDGGVCRIHPTKLVFENFADGTTNPWGVDFDDYGQCFVSNCVNPHLFHVIQGAHYEPWRNRPSSLYAYERIPTIADHLHYPVNQPKAMRGETPETLAMGGGHAHCGTLIYLGGAFPERYRNSVFMCNVHGRRINNDILKRSGSGYVASHGPDFMISGDPWFMGVTLRTGPDGAIYVSDWSDTGECHTYKPDRSSGRIYRISYEGGAVGSAGTKGANGNGTQATDATNANGKSNETGAAGPVAGADVSVAADKSIRPIGPNRPIPSTPIDPKTAAAAKLPLSDRTDAELVQLQLHPNDWFVRHARRLLQERRRNGQIAKATTATLIRWSKPDSGLPTDRRLRALWARYAIAELFVPEMEELLADRDEHIRAWGVRFLAMTVPPSGATSFRVRIKEPAFSPVGSKPHEQLDSLLRVIERDAEDERRSKTPSLFQLAQDDPSPVVRLALASALQPVAFPKFRPRLRQYMALLSHAEDATDSNLPLMYWYGVEPLVKNDANAFIALIANSAIPKIREFGARRFVDHALTLKEEASYEPLVAELGTAKDEAARDLLNGTREALRGRKRIAMPSNWPATYAKLKASSDPEVRKLTASLAVTFGDPAVIADLRTTASSKDAKSNERVAAIELLRDQAQADLGAFLLTLLDDKDVRRATVRALASTPHAQTPSQLVSRYSGFSTEEKQDAVATLTSRKDWSLALLDAVEKKSVPRNDVSAYAARQMHAFGDDALTKKLRTVWGEIRDSAPEKQQQIAKLKSQLSPASLKNADLAMGKVLFKKTCQQCHRLFGEGGTIGPDITGSNRTNLDYLLGNIIDPSAEIGRDYRMSIVTTQQGRVVTGLQVESTPTRLTLQTATEKIVLDRNDIEEIKESPLSIMPEGQLNSLSKDDIRDLIGFLSTP
mgnify:CR=1 FL=1